ncbi:MAG: amidase [Rhodospirillaceae bacterium]|nr:amidase [Rhodospirillaceae bacterium]
MHTIAAARQALAAGQMTARALVEQVLARAEDPSGEGARAYTNIYSARARTAADAADRLADAGGTPAPLAGIPISIKDLFDVAGETTLAGSVALKGAAPAAADAAIVRRLRAAGAVIVGKTNMTEFAFSGLGLNPHYGTPASPWDRASRRIPGGSSSGAGVSVADGMALAAIGTDTGGSVRIPAAFNGVVGFKPTARRVPTAGAFPLSTTLDSIGPLAPSVACCALIDAVMSGAEPAPLPQRPAKGLRIAAPQRYLLDGADATVAAAFGAALSRLSAAGAQIDEIPLAELEEIPRIMQKGAVVTVEAFAIHRALLAAKEAAYDARVATRIKLGGNVSAADYYDMLQRRAELIARVSRITANYDAVVCPTVPIVAPTIASLERDDDLYVKTNMLVLRNTTAFNFLDRCAVSLPIHRAGDAPVGMMIVGEPMADAALLGVAAAIEAALAR